MVTRTRTNRATAKYYEYRVRGVKGEKTKITARNTQDAVNKVHRMYPRARLLGVERISKTGREYETTWIDR
jgi:HPt (histidine-containing phosphotransfer) domain-containing protein